MSALRRWTGLLTLVVCGERAVGLSGGHIFQGECLPDQMWDRRFSPRTPIDGLYMCGASTHPGGGVFAASGYNTAQVILAERGSELGILAQVAPLIRVVREVISLFSTPIVVVDVLGAPVD